MAERSRQMSCAHTLDNCFFATPEDGGREARAREGRGSWREGERQRAGEVRGAGEKRYGGCEVWRGERYGRREGDGGREGQRGERERGGGARGTAGERDTGRGRRGDGGKTAGARVEGLAGRVRQAVPMDLQPHRVRRGMGMPGGDSRQFTCAVPGGGGCERGSWTGGGVGVPLRAR